ncbi:MAG: sulfite exporter TauE/SafE family protein [Actinomycetota bacterium]
MTVAQLIVVATAVFVAAFMQVLSGFGFALLSMPIMTLAVPVEQAVVISTLLGCLSTSWQAWHLRENALRPLVKRLSLAAFLGMPLGLFILNVVSDKALKLTLGVAVLMATALLVSHINLKHAGPALDFGVGFVSGVLNTSLSTNGPPLVFGLQARHLQADEFRATISMVFAFSNIVGITLFAIDGKFSVHGVEAALIALPAWFVGQALAWPIRRHVHGERFRTLVLSMMVIAGASTIFFALR